MSGRRTNGHASAGKKNGIRCCGDAATVAAPKANGLPVHREVNGRLKDVDGVPRFRDNGRLTAGDRPDLADLEPVELLTRFHDDNDNGAFEELMNRYGGMVFSTCRRVLRDDHEAEDVTQATFLMLASRHKATKNVHKVGPWLRKVSHRLSLDALRTKKRRTKRENNRPIWNDGEKLAGHNVGNEERRQIVRECIDELPVKYRMPVILFHFGGMSRDEIADELGCRANTLGVRLHRARNMLAKSLEARGVTMAGVAMTALLTDAVRTAIGSSMMQQTTVAAGEIAAGGGGMSALLGTEISSKVLALTQSTAAFGMGKAKLATLVFAGASTVLTGGGFAAHYAGASETMFDAVENVIDRTPRLFDVQNLVPDWSTPMRLPTIDTGREKLSAAVPDDEIDDLAPTMAANPGLAANPNRPFVENLNQRRLQWAVIQPGKDAAAPIAAQPRLAAPNQAQGDDRPAVAKTPPLANTAPAIAVATPPESSVEVDVDAARLSSPSAGSSRPRTAVADARDAAADQPDATPDPTVTDRTSGAGAGSEALPEVVVNEPAPTPDVSPTTPVTPTSNRPTAPTQILLPSPAPELVALAGTAFPSEQAYAANLPATPTTVESFVIAETTPATSILGSNSLFDRPIDPFSDAAPETPGHHTFIGLWDIDGQTIALETPSEFDIVGIEVPYDPDAAAAVGAPIERLKLWAYNHDDGWYRVYDESLYHNITDHVIGGRIPTNAAIVGVSFPEPAIMGLLATGAAPLLPRRRRGSRSA